MRRVLPLCLALAFAAPASPSLAWLLYPDRERPERLIVEIERSFGDAVPLRRLPSPFDTALQEEQGPDALSFRWRYDRQAQGLAFLRVDSEGRGALELRFADRNFTPGGRLGAAVVLAGKDGEAMHTFYVRSVRNPRPGPRGSGGFSAARLELSRPPAWWREVDEMIFFFMIYHPIQKLDQEGMWRAMRNAVERITDGKGTSQRG